MTYGIDIIKALYFFLPAFVANSLPVYAFRFNWLPPLNKPIDQETSWREKRILGDNKTVRGFAIGVVGALIIGLAQHLLYLNFDFIKTISITDQYNGLIFSIGIGVLQGFGALVGDSVKSFFKRRFGIAPGKPWLGPDQFDYILGGVILGLPFYVPNFKVFIIIFIAGIILHFISNAFMKIFGIRKSWL